MQGVPNLSSMKVKVMLYQGFIIILFFLKLILTLGANKCPSIRKVIISTTKAVKTGVKVNTLVQPYNNNYISYAQLGCCRKYWMI